jgi:excisionase family DNA binding protein
MTTESLKVVTVTTDELEAIVERALKRVLSTQLKAKLWFNLREAAQMLGWKEATLQERCRAKKVPFHRDGHKYYFTKADLDQITGKSVEESNRGVKTLSTVVV